MAGNIGGAANFLGNALIPETMHRFQAMNAAEQGARAQQVQDATVRSLINTGGAVGTPATKAYEFNGQTYGQNRAETPLVSRETNMGNLQRAAPQAFNAAALQSMIGQVFPAPISVKDRFVGTPGEGGVLDITTQAIVPGTRTDPKQPADVQSALFQANGDPAKARSILAGKGVNGEWAINAANGRMEFVTPQTLLSAQPGKYMKPPSGMKITTDGQGGFEMVTGDMAANDGMTKPTAAGLEQTIIQGRDSLARLNAIKLQAKPEYQQLQTRWGTMVSAGKEKLGFGLDPAARQTLNDYTKYRRDVVANTNQTIKDLTGATVGVSEAPRLLQQMPVAGQGLIDGDSPTEFDAKMNATMDAITASIARAEYARTNGLTKKQQFAIPLDTVPQMINAKGDQYRDEILRANPNIPPEELAEMVKTRLRQEFGLQ